MSIRIYIAGPMTGIEDYNRPAFSEAQKHLEDLGYVAVNPARIKLPNDATWQDYMRVTMCDLAWCDGVALLTGWRTSTGAKTEHAWATRVGLQVMPLSQWKKVTE